MRIKISFFLLLFILFNLDIYSQKIIINKESHEVPSKELIIYRYNQAFFDFKIPVVKITTGDEKAVETNLEETTCLYIDYGPYKTYFFAEPEKSYLIVLPDITGLSDDWTKNPYFKPSNYHLHCFEIDEFNHPSKLNEEIREFDAQFEPFLNKQLLSYYNPRIAREQLDSFIHYQITPRGMLSDDFFSNYILYKKGILEYNIKTHNLDKLTEEYFTSKEIRFSSPAYRELFCMVFQSYFNHLADKEDYRDVFYQLATKQYAQLEDYLSDLEVFNQKAIFSNILLNEIYQAYYSINFDRKKLLNILRTIMQNATDPAILNTAQELERLFTSLETSYPAPEFRLMNINGEERKINDFEGKYVYLGFCDIKSLSCMREVEYLKFLHSRFSEKLEILYCVIGEEQSEIESFIEWNNIAWEVFPVNQDDKLLKDYKVMAFPVFYLIDKDGTLLRNPAPNPSENFEQIFTEILRSEKKL